LLSAAGLVMIYTITAPRLEAAGSTPAATWCARPSLWRAGGDLHRCLVHQPRQWKGLAPYAYVAALLLLLIVLTPHRGDALRGAALDPARSD